MRIGHLRISRFKSIRQLDLACRKVNVFIGPPDSGKTNVLEALNFLSRLAWRQPIDGSLRLTQDPGLDALFFEQFFDQPLSIEVDHIKVTAQLSGAERRMKIRLLVGENDNGGGEIEFGQPLQTAIALLQPVRYYAYAGAERWQYTTNPLQDGTIIATPSGENLTYVARHTKAVYDFLKEVVSTLEWKVRFDQVSKRFRLSEVRDDDIVDYNIELLSDSIKRFFFFGSILLTSTNAVLVFDEPDVQAFPPYPKELGRLIAEDQQNQFFLTTHNPYILSELVEKTPTQDLAIFVCRRRAEHGTELHMLDDSQVKQIIDWGSDTFFNLTQFDW